MTIETKDHLLLARELACQMKLSHGKKLAFILGNLIPDFNPFSYITFGNTTGLEGIVTGSGKI